jgi:hypothetical protein
MRGWRGTLGIFWHTRYQVYFGEINVTKIIIIILWEFCKLTHSLSLPSTQTRASYLVPNHLPLQWVATNSAPLHHEEGPMTAEAKSMNMSGVGIAPEITDHPHVVRRSVEKNMTQNVANGVEKEVRSGVAMRRVDVKRAKSASQCILNHDFPLTNFLKAEEG